MGAGATIVARMGAVAGAGSPGPDAALPAAMAGHDAGHGRERAAADAAVGGGSWGEDAAGSHGERRRALEAVG